MKKAGFTNAFPIDLGGSHFVVDSGRTRRTQGGDEAVVWVAAEFSRGQA